MRLKLYLISLFFFTCSLFVVMGYFFFIFPSKPFSDKKEEFIFYLQPGMSAKFALQSLKKAGMMNAFQAQLFSIWIQYQQSETQLQAGEYAIPSNITPKRLLNKWVKGQVVIHSITFPEGITFLEARNMIATKSSLKKLTQQKTSHEVMELLGEPDVLPEGLFFPDTYYYTSTMSDLDILRFSRKMMQKRLQQAWNNRSSTIVLTTPYEALIMASIIEKEAFKPEEWALISGVFQRRLARNMRLQADPTVIYGLEKNFQGQLTREDLKQDSPYNTYTRKGLPPTPIALPGVGAIEAALHPDTGKSLYFVAKGDGTHHFSETLEEHNRAVAQYQRGTIRE